MIQRKFWAICEGAWHLLWASFKVIASEALILIEIFSKGNVLVFQNNSTTTSVQPPHVAFAIFLYSFFYDFTPRFNHFNFFQSVL